MQASGDWRLTLFQAAIAMPGFLFLAPKGVNGNVLINCVSRQSRAGQLSSESTAK